MSEGLSIKGVSDGLLIQVPEGEWDEALTSLLRLVDEKADFFRGARVALQLEDRDLGAAVLGRLRDDLAERQVNLWAVLATSPQTRSAAADLGLALELTRSLARPTPDDAPADTALDGEQAILIHRTLRSGHTIHFPGHVTVVGDVNPGAEIVAGGDILVWGRLRGVAHAGAAGDETAVVCALDLAPTQLRIASHIAVSPERRGRPQPEIARIRDGQLVAEKWGDERHR
jgi:septum site-determining protein MinC